MLQEPEPIMLHVPELFMPHDPEPLIVHDPEPLRAPLQPQVQVVAVTSPSPASRVCGAAITRRLCSTVRIRGILLINARIAGERLVFSVPVLVRPVVSARLAQEQVVQVHVAQVHTAPTEQFCMSALPLPCILLLLAA